MVQVRKEYLRLIVVKAWNDKVPACDKSLELRLLSYTSLIQLRESCLTKLKTLSPERLAALQNEAVAWFMYLSPNDSSRFFNEYDALPHQIPEPYRIDWTKQIPLRNPGSLVDHKM